MLSDIKVGDRVRSCLTGWGTVCKNWESGFYPIEVNFDNGTTREFSKKGQYRLLDENPEIVEVIRKEWEPEGGKWIIEDTGSIYDPTNKETHRILKKEGRAYPTEELAEKAYSMIRSYQRLVAYVLEHAPNYEPDWDNKNEDKHYICYDHYDMKWKTRCNWTHNAFTVYMPENVAGELVEKLNSEEIIL